jgi:hypothetical protein
MFIKLHGALMSFSGFSGTEGAQVAAAAGFRVFFAGVKPVLSTLQFSNHDDEFP